MKDAPALCVCVGEDIPQILTLPQERGNASKTNVQHAHTHTGYAVTL